MLDFDFKYNTFRTIMYCGEPVGMDFRVGG